LPKKKKKDKESKYLTVNGMLYNRIED